jgi:hypothetical protein
MWRPLCTPLRRYFVPTPLALYDTSLRIVKRPLRRLAQKLQIKMGVGQGKDSKTVDEKYDKLAAGVVSLIASYTTLKKNVAAFADVIKVGALLCSG